MTKIFVSLDENKYIESVFSDGEIPNGDAGEIKKIEVYENHEVFNRPEIYQVIDGELIRDDEKAKPTIYFDLDDDGFLTGTSSSRGSESDFQLTVKEGHEVLVNPFIFKYVDGKLSKSEDRRQELIDDFEEHENKPTTEELINIILGGENY